MLVVFLVLAVLCLDIAMGVPQQPHGAEKGLGEGSSMGFSLSCCPDRATGVLWATQVQMDLEGRRR